MSVNPYEHILTFTEITNEAIGSTRRVRVDPISGSQRDQGKEAHGSRRPTVARPVLFPSNPVPTLRTKLTLALYSGLDFTAQGLRNNQSNSTEELATSFRTSYGNTLKPHHGMMVRPIFSAAMSACPTRANFYEKLGGGNEKTMADMKTWLAALEKQVGILKAFLATKEAQWK